MRFMLIAHADKDSEAGVPPKPELMGALGKFGEDLVKSGVMLDTGGLMPSATGSKIRVSGGKVTVTDGPFTEAKEIIAGYAIVQVKSKEEAVEIARRFYQVHTDILGPDYEAVGEIRQLYDMVPGQQ